MFHTAHIFTVEIVSMHFITKFHIYFFMFITFGFVFVFLFFAPQWYDRGHILLLWFVIMSTCYSVSNLLLIIVLTTVANIQVKFEIWVYHMNIQIEFKFGFAQKTFDRVIPLELRNRISNFLSDHFLNNRCTHWTLFQNMDTGIVRFWFRSADFETLKNDFFLNFRSLTSEWIQL